ncbi:MAG: NFACT family protein [Candidatus Methanoplasma sp.]|jgi:predicted ribosome quality control (RQC) complex YloA/Tae2 family protein|nr:NFACT family protein [Candidatus Methanoplasma sp.]
MKKEMSSFDVRSVASEMASLEGGHMDKIFHWGAGNVLFRINAAGGGKRELFFKDKKWLYLAPSKPDTPEAPTSFATFLRKYIDNARVGKTFQAGSDRLTVTELFKSDAEYKLVFELFGGGNVLLLLDGKIVNCLTHRTWRDRVTRPGEEYSMPKARFDPMSSSFEDFAAAFGSSGADAVRTLATAVNLGGQYAEEVCKRAGMDKSAPAAGVPPADLETLYSAMRGIVEKAMGGGDPTAFVRDGRIEDIAPVDMASYEGLERRRFPTMSLAIDALIRESKEEEDAAAVDPDAERLRKRIEKQRETIESYLEEAEGLKARADALYADYQAADGLLKVLLEQSSRISWEKLREGAMKIPYVTGIDPSKSLVTGRFSGMEATLDYTKSLDANASDLYGRGKEAGEKASRAEEAARESEAELEKIMKGLDRAKALAMSRAQPTKQFWFERYKWFVTSSGRLVIAGRDAHSNDNIVKKHLKERDVFAHADVHGAPSVILKDGAAAPPEDLRDACAFALAQSKAWVAAMAEGSAFWALPDQVSKTPNAGEFVPRGAFIVRGKRNYEHHLAMELAVGEVLYEGHRKVMCGPVRLFEGSGKYVVIRPGRGKGGKTAGELAKSFAVPEEEISRILPPGDAEIARREWPGENET